MQVSMEDIAKKYRLYLCTAIVGSLVIHKLLQWWRNTWYDNQCARMRTGRNHRVSNLKQRLSRANLDQDDTKYITSLSVEQLSDNVRSGKLSAVDVLHAYQQRAVEAHERTNCLTNVIEDVELWAKELDERTVNRDGLLYGFPVSIKDCIPTEGHVNSRGCVSFLDSISKEDATLVKALKAQGAIPFVKTNIPQLMMAMETHNAVYGSTSNPLDLTRTCGGSSGGEGALIACGGSLLGIGTDTGGSIRIPSTFCGITGLKPTSGRISLKGPVPFGQTVVRSCWGPMAQSVQSLVVCMKAILTEVLFEGDKTIPPLSFNDKLYESRHPMTIGYYVDDGMFPACPAMQRAVLESKALLEERGHKLEPWTPPDIEEAFKGMYRSFSGDRGCMYRQFLAVEKIDSSIIGLMSSFFYSSFERFLRIMWAKLRGRKLQVLSLQGARGVPSVSEWFSWTTQAKLYEQKVESEWRQLKLDAVICPAFWHVANKKLWTLDAPATYNLYAGLYNLLDFPAGVVPVTRVTKADVEALQKYCVSDKAAACMVRDQTSTEGLPVNVQCVAPMWREETCLRLMRAIEEAVNGQSS